MLQLDPLVGITLIPLDIRTKISSIRGVWYSSRYKKENIFHKKIAEHKWNRVENGQETLEYFVPNFSTFSYR